jgi:AGZA family xanthine/uracil permease-like MFS transporter
MIARYFEFARLNTTLRTEILAGFTTFVTMAYIVFVNAGILADAGLPPAAVMAATCASAGFASVLMGVFARFPIALAPGMGLNAYFTYTVVKGLGVSWQVALGAVFLSGVAFLILTLAGIREKLFTALPHELYPAVAVGIGLFIAFIGFRNAGIIEADRATLVTLGRLSRPECLLALIGLLLMAALQARGVKAAIVIGIVTITAVSSVLGLTHWTPRVYSLAEITATAFQLDIAGALRLGFLEILFVFLFVDLFDNLGTLVAVTKKANLVNPSGEIPRLNRILLTDAVATMTGACAGTSTVVSYIESTAGIVAGGRSGFTAVVTGCLFLVLLVFAPLAGAIPNYATAPALILVGAAMIGHVSEIRWDDAVVAVPAFLTLTAIPLSFSIANGLAIGFTSFALLKLFTGRGREVSWLVWLLAILFILRFAYLGKA